MAPGGTGHVLLVVLTPVAHADRALDLGLARDPRGATGRAPRASSSCEVRRRARRRCASERKCLLQTWLIFGSAISAPKAEVSPGRRDDDPRHPHLSAMSQAWSGPAPPKATSAYSRGSSPRSIERTRMALAMFSLAMSTTACAALGASSPGARPARRRFARGLGLELDRAAEEVVRVEPAQRQIGVGDGHLLAAGVVADAGPDRRRRSAGRREQAALVDPGDRAAAGADGGRRRRRGRPAGRTRSRSWSSRRLAVADQADVAGGAAHVEGDCLLGRPRARAEVLPGDDPAGQTGEQQLRLGLAPPRPSASCRRSTSSATRARRRPARERRRRPRRSAA